IYENVGGLNAGHANLLQAVLWLFTVLLTFFGFMKLGDKYSRKFIFGLGASMGIFAWIMLTFMPMIWLLMYVIVVILGPPAGIRAQAVYALRTRELFPTRYRASAEGLMYFIVRTGIAIWTFILPTLMPTLGFKVAGIVMITFLVIQLIIGLLLAPNTQGRTLKEIEKERYGNVVNSETTSD